MGIELELLTLLILQTVGFAVFGRFEVETAPWRKILKWAIFIGLTLAVYRWAGHWALLVPGLAAAAGLTVHTVWCRRHQIDLLAPRPLRRYYELRGWTWPYCA